MKLDVVQEGALTIVAPRGDVVLACAADLRRALTDLVAQGRVRILVDLTGVPYVDSSGLSLLIGVMKEARGQGGDFGSAAPSRRSARCSS